MSFTLTGRWQTRLATLIGPMALTWLFAVFTDKRDYWIVFGLMLAVGLVLDLGVYGWLIGYQPRWLTLLLATLEFFILKGIMEWPYPLEIRLHTRQALELYLPAWLLIWLTLHIAIPFVWPRWVEDGGEFRSARTRHAVRHYQPLGSLALRRQAYGYATIALAATLLPWIIAGLVTPSDQVFTGLLLNEPGHLQALAEMTAVIKGGPVTSLAGIIGWIARVGWWPPLTLYQLVWMISVFMFLLGLQIWCRGPGLPFIIAVALITPALPLPWLMAAAASIWFLTLAPLPRPSLPKTRAPLMIGLLASLVLGWGLIWLRLPTAPLLRLDQDDWQALTWLRQGMPRDTRVASSAELQPLIVAFGGQAPADSSTARLLLTSGAVCNETSSTIRFRHGAVCVLAQARMAEVQP